MFNQNIENIKNNEKGVSLLMSNYIKVSDKVQSRRDISSTAKLIFSDLCYRMRLSLKHKSFYDKKHGYYVVYKVSDLADKAGCSKGAVIRALKQLESKSVHLIKRIRKMHYTQIFIPKLAKFHNRNHQSSKTEIVNRINNLKTKKNNNNSVCKNSGKSEKSKSVSEYSKHWNTDNRTIININNLSKDFGTRLVIEAIKIATHRDFYTKPFNYISGVVQKLKKRKSNKSRFMYAKQSYRPRRKPIKETMPRWYTHPKKDGKVTNAQKKRIAYWTNKFNQQQAERKRKFKLD